MSPANSGTSRTAAFCRGWVAEKWINYTSFLWEIAKMLLQGRQGIHETSRGILRKHACTVSMFNCVELSFVSTCHWRWDLRHEAVTDN